MPILSIQLYSLRNAGDLPTQLDIARDAGFRTVETIGAMLEEPHRTRALLDERGLEARSGHVGLPALREKFDATAEAARTVGIETMILPALHGADRPTDADGWRRIGEELGATALRFANEGLKFAYHNHAWEVAPLPDGSLPLDLVLDAGAPGGLWWQGDLAWLIRGGDDPEVRIDRHSRRLHSIHVKDIAPEAQASDEDGWSDVGHGTVDWPRYWVRAAEHTQLMIAEHDKPSDPARFARRSFEAMDKLDRGAA